MKIGREVFQQIAHAGVDRRGCDDVVVVEHQHAARCERLFCPSYAAAVSDVYQDLFGSGIYVGKGAYDVEAFRRSLDGRVPENALASHPAALECAVVPAPDEPVTAILTTYGSVTRGTAPYGRRWWSRSCCTPRSLSDISQRISLA